MKIKETLCVSCGHEKAEVKYLTKNFGKGANLMVIENVPMVYCPKCTVTYMTSETMKIIDQIRQSRNQVEKRQIPVAQFAS